MEEGHKPEIYELECFNKRDCIYNIFYEKKILSSTFRKNETISTFLSSFYAITPRLRNTFKKEFEKIPVVKL